MFLSWTFKSFVTFQLEILPKKVENKDKIKVREKTTKMQRETSYRSVIE